MTSIILHSSSIQNTFISTIDHLPCDIIRSLWLIQSCNISINNNKQELHQLLQKLQHQKQPKRQEILSQLKDIKTKLRHLNAEAIAESQALHNQLVTHKIYLDDEVQQLKIISNNASNPNGKHEDHVKLREQLIQHYKEFPLTSLKEALKEQEHKDTKSDKSDKSDKPDKPDKPEAKSNGSGIRLVLKLSSNKAVPKVKAKPPVPKVTKPIKKIPTKANNSIAAFQPSVLPPPAQIEEDNKPYCFCKQPSFGDMIACDNEESCPNGEWFHYKCVGLLNRVEALKYTTGKVKWFCSDHCREVVESQVKPKKKRRKRRSAY